MMFLILSFFLSLLEWVLCSITKVKFFAYIVLELDMDPSEFLATYTSRPLLYLSPSLSLLLFSLSFSFLSLSLLSLPLSLSFFFLLPRITFHFFYSYSFYYRADQRDALLEQVRLVTSLGNDQSDNLKIRIFARHIAPLVKCLVDWKIGRIRY